MLGAFGSALRGIEIAHLGGLGWMWGVELVLFENLLGLWRFTMVSHVLFVVDGL